jgi:hypothetical protein
MMNRLSTRSPTDHSLRPKELPHASLMSDVIVEICSDDGEKTFPIRANSREPPSSPASSSSLKATNSSSSLVRLSLPRRSVTCTSSSLFWLSPPCDPLPDLVSTVTAGREEIVEPELKFVRPQGNPKEGVSENLAVHYTHVWGLGFLWTPAWNKLTGGLQWSSMAGLPPVRRGRHRRSVRRCCWAVLTGDGENYQWFGIAIRITVITFHFAKGKSRSRAWPS